MFNTQVFNATGTVVNPVTATGGTYSIINCPINIDTSDFTGATNLNISSTSGPIFSTGRLSADIGTTGGGLFISKGLNRNLIGNVAIGNTLALNSTTTGAANLAIGNNALQNTTTGGSNVGLGVNALAANTTGSVNVGIGPFALTTNSIGTSNVGIGNNALANNTTGSVNVAIGEEALYTNTTGNNTLAIGYRALRSLTTGTGHIAVGPNALRSVTTGSNMVAFGSNSLENIVTGTGNIGIGANTLQYLNGVNGNTAIGNQGQGVNFSGAFNTSVGGASLIQIIAGSNNTGLGQATLQNLTDTVASLGAITPGSGYTDGSYGGVNLITDHFYGFTAGNLTADIVVSGGAVTGVTIVAGRGVRNGAILTIYAATAPAGLLTGSGFSVPVASVNVSSGNTAVGRDALRNGYQASNNTALGNAAGGNATGSSNVFIGYQAGQNETGSNKLYIDNSNTATPLIGGDFSANTVTIGGTITANSLITAGGLSTQFVKGDGSLDSTSPVGATGPTGPTGATGPNYGGGGYLANLLGNFGSLFTTTTNANQNAFHFPWTLGNNNGGSDNVQCYYSGGSSVGNYSGTPGTNFIPINSPVGTGMLFGLYSGMDTAYSGGASWVSTANNGGSLSMWIRRAAPPASTIANWMYTYTNSDNNVDSNKARILTDGRFAFNPRMSTTNGTEITTGISVCDDVWHNIVFTFQRDNGNMKCYVDGVLQETQTDYPINGALSFASTSVGCSNTAFGPVTFVQDLLTAAEVLDLYESSFTL
jgi:hypothetical protein